LDISAALRKMGPKTATVGPSAMVLDVKAVMVVITARSGSPSITPNVDATTKSFFANQVAAPVAISIFPMEIAPA